MTRGPGPAVQDMVGKRYGNFIVLGVGGLRRYPCGKARRLVRVRCGCGRVMEKPAHELRYGRIVRCATCRQAYAAEVARRLSVVLPSGRTVVEVAHDAGLRPDTVYARWRRGWPESHLGARPFSTMTHKGGGDRVRPPQTQALRRALA